MMGKEIDIKIKEKISIDYKNGMELNNICEKYHCSKQTCYRSLKLFNINLRMPFERTSKEKEKKIVSLYKEGNLVSKISRNLNISTGTVYSILKKNGFKFEKNIKSIDHFYFHNVNNEEKAYWLGFLSADGHISEKTNFIRLELKIEDYNHIEKFKNNIKSEHKICKNNKFDKRTKKVYKSCSISFNSKQIKDDLSKFEILFSKTKTLKSPKINLKLLKHYWRGFLDGDGGIGLSKKRWSISLCGTYEICSEFSNFVANNINWKFKSPLTEGSIFVIKYSGVNISKKICKLLYNNSTVFLDRKMILYLKLKKTKSQKKYNRVNQFYSKTYDFSVSQPSQLNDYLMVEDELSKISGAK